MRAIQRCQICRAEYYDIPVCVHSMEEWDRYLDMDGFAAPKLTRRERRLQAKAERSAPPKETQWECGNANCSAVFVTPASHTTNRCPECGGTSFHKCPEDDTP